jgi:hypothetical protein
MITELQDCRIAGLQDCRIENAGSRCDPVEIAELRRPRGVPRMITA